MAPNTAFDEVVAEFFANQARLQISNSSVEATTMEGIDGNTGSKDPSMNQKQTRTKIDNLLVVALALIVQQVQPVEPNAFTYTIEKLMSMSKKPEGRTTAVMREVYWALKDALDCNEMTEKARQEVKLVHAMLTEGSEKLREEARASDHQMFDVLECKTKSIREQQNAETTVIRAIQYFEKE